MQKECVSTKKSLRKYLRGHLFKYEQIRIARHLNACPVCRSEFQALKKVADTRQLLKDITPPEGLGGRMKQGVSVLGRVKLLFYRPLWLLAIIGIITLLYLNVVAPRRHDVELENIEKSLPVAEITTAPTVTPVSDSVPVQLAPVQQVQTAASSRAASPAVEPLVVTLTAEDEKAAAGRINEVMRGHSHLLNLKFSETVKEISGHMTSKELLIFFNRIEDAAKVSYSRKKFQAFPSAEPIPFIIKIKQAPPKPEPQQNATMKQDLPQAGETPQPLSSATRSTL